MGCSGEAHSHSLHDVNWLPGSSCNRLALSRPLSHLAHWGHVSGSREGSQTEPGHLKRMQKAVSESSQHLVGRGKVQALWSESIPAVCLPHTSSVTPEELTRLLQVCFPLV